MADDFNPVLVARITALQTREDEIHALLNLPTDQAVKDAVDAWHLEVQDDATDKLRAGRDRFDLLAKLRLWEATLQGGRISVADQQSLRTDILNTITDIEQLARP